MAGAQRCEVIITVSYEYIECEHAFVRQFGRFASADVNRDEVRILPRRLRRQLARRWAGRRVPIVVPLDVIDRFIADLQAELDRRAVTRGGGE